MEILNAMPNGQVGTVLFDFDGTISTLRCGWEEVMAPMMIEILSACGAREGEDIPALVEKFIDESTGIQTIFQMKWLANEVDKRGGAARDPWDYKAEYNRRLMLRVEEKKAALRAGNNPDAFLMAGARDFLLSLKARGIRVLVASGTDDPDVRAEAAALGVINLFDEIRGAPPHEENCSKAAVITRLIEAEGLKGDALAVIGDGKVEIELAKRAGARAIGIASDEIARKGVNPIKRARLINAGADAICGDFLEQGALFALLGRDLEAKEMEYKTLDFSNIKTEAARQRVNLVRIETLLNPGAHVPAPLRDDDFEALVDRIISARAQGRQVIFSMGAHVIKNHLSRYIIELMKLGIITHIAGNGALSIHDFELAYLGGTSEDVPTAIEDGSFGMWEETGRWMNEAIIWGAARGMGYGESLAVYMDTNAERFPYLNDCVLYQAWKAGVPATYHIALGTDIIHQHPLADFGAIGQTSGVDFRRMCASVSELDGGVYLNFGSAVIGPEVFLKALSISRNLGYPTFNITTANFDLIELGDYRAKIGYDDPNYYYRPRKNIVNRPVSRGGKGWHFSVDHKISIPNLYERILAKGWAGK